MNSARKIGTIRWRPGILVSRTIISPNCISTLPKKTLSLADRLFRSHGNSFVRSYGHADLISNRKEKRTGIENIENRVRRQMPNRMRYKVNIMVIIIVEMVISNDNLNRNMRKISSNRPLFGVKNTQQKHVYKTNHACICFGPSMSRKAASFGVS